jgi:hypothetical protein
MAGRDHVVSGQLGAAIRSRCGAWHSILEADYDPLWGSLIKQTVRRVHPGFQESHDGYRTFAALLEDLEDLGYIELDHDRARGNFKVFLVDD